MKTMTCIALCASLVAAPIKAAEPPPPEFAGKAVAGVVICVGGYCIYKMVKLCQKLLPKEKKPDNTETNELAFVTNTDEYGASWNYESIGYCEPDTNALQTVSLDINAYVATLKITVDESGQVASSISAVKDTDGSRSQTWEEFQQEVASHGLVVSGMGDGSKYYSRNRIPCGPEGVPIEFHEPTRTIVFSGGPPTLTRIITVEQSSDMKTWYQLMRIGTTYGTGLQVEDLARSSQMFYRIIVQ